MLDFIVNPVAGKGRAAAAREQIKKRLHSQGVEYRIHETRAVGQGEDLARALTASGSDTIVAVGGDGTLSEVINGLNDPSSVRLGLIPAGGGNDFAAAARIPSDPMAALDLILGGKARPTDYMECSGRRGINIIGAGIDVDILRAYARQRLRGPVGYLLALVRTLLRFDFYEFSEIRDEQAVPHCAFIACAGNGQRYGGGITVCPEAKIDDGLLDIVIVDNLKKALIPAAFVRLMRKQILALPQTQFRRDDHLIIRSDKPMTIQIDGEIQEGLPFDVRLVPGGLNMFRP